jgi:hypothetical protein
MKYEVFLYDVSRSSSEIQMRIEEVNALITQMTQERWKSNDKGYIEHLCDEISNLQGQRDALVWVSLQLPKCKCGQNTLPYKAQIEIDKCSRCGNYH